MTAFIPLFFGKDPQPRARMPTELGRGVTPSYSTLHMSHPNIEPGRWHVVFGTGVFFVHRVEGDTVVMETTARELAKEPLQYVAERARPIGTRAEVLQALAAVSTDPAPAATATGMALETVLRRAAASGDLERTLRVLQALERGGVTAPRIALRVLWPIVADEVGKALGMEREQSETSLRALLTGRLSLSGFVEAVPAPAPAETPTHVPSPYLPHWTELSAELEDANEPTLARLAANGHVTQFYCDAESFTDDGSYAKALQPLLTWADLPVTVADRWVDQDGQCAVVLTLTHAGQRRALIAPAERFGHLVATELVHAGLAVALQLSGSDRVGLHRTDETCVLALVPREEVASAREAGLTPLPETLPPSVQEVDPSTADELPAEG